jgi:carbamoylphosphate synthase large subunit
MIDIKSLEPGDEVSVADIENHTGEKYGTDKYTYAALALQGEIGETIECFVRRHKGKLIVLGPNDGVAYAATLSSGAMKKLASVNHRLNAWISESELDEDMKQRYRHQLKINSQVIQLYTTTRRAQRKKELLFKKKE